MKTHVLQKTQHPSQLSESYSLKASRGKLLSDILPGATEFYFPGENFKIGSMPPHTAIIGSSGAGKTIIQKIWLEGALLAPTDDELLYRGMVYDPKRELYPFLLGMGLPAEQIIIANPFDSRASAWDIGADFKEPAQIEELAEMIIPRKEEKGGSGGNDDFFDTASRIILQDIIAGFRAWAFSCWDLNDLTEACSNLDHIRQLLAHTENGRNSWNTFLKPKSSDDRMSDSILATLFASVRPFQTLGALWARCSDKFSLENWHRGSGVILMGADPRRETSLTRMNQLMFRRTSQLVLSREDENPEDLTWFFLDEVREAQKLEGIRQLLTEGRSKGARVILGFQDVDGMIDLYGERGAEEIVGLCANRIILHLDNPRTRDWACHFFGEAELSILSYGQSMNSGESSGGGGRSTNFGSGENLSEQVGMRKNILPVELHDLPLASKEGGVSGFYASPRRAKNSDESARGRFNIPSEDYEIMFDFVKNQPPATLERPSSDQNRLKWSRADFFRFGIKTENNADGGRVIETSESLSH